MGELEAGRNSCAGSAPAVARCSSVSPSRRRGGVPLIGYEADVTAESSPHVRGVFLPADAGCRLTRVGSPGGAVGEGWG
ncbi:hypothetical protein ACFQ60_00720 [Streptomyces zhihengii]